MNHHSNEMIALPLNAYLLSYNLISSNKLSYLAHIFITVLIFVMLQLFVYLIHFHKTFGINENFKNKPQSISREKLFRNQMLQIFFSFCKIF